MRKLILILVGLLLVGFGVSQQLLAVAGETRGAVVTGVKSETRTSRNSSGRTSTERYYAVKYGFTASDGSSQSGQFERSQENVPPKVGSTVYVKYLPFYPSLSAGGDEVSMALGGLGMMGLGLAILFFGAKR